MDDKQLINGLHGLALAEPPLGFDPDEVATTADKKVRNRRATIGVGLATLAVLGSAVTLLGPGAGPSTVEVAAGPSGAPPSKEGKALPPIDPKVTAILRHLRDVVPAIVPEAKDITIPDFLEPSSPGVVTATVEFRDQVGPATFNLTVTSAEGSTGMKSLDKVCGDGTNPVTVKGTGRPLRCEKIAQPDGSTLLVQEVGEQSKAQMGTNEVERVAGIHATHYRADGSTVNAGTDGFVPVYLADRFGYKNPDGTSKTSRPSAPLTEQQLITLVTDPAFTLK
jgi:hypothetical protein